MLALVVLIAVAAAVGGWFLGRELTTPEAAAAEAAAPEPSILAVPVESRSLSKDVVVRGQPKFENSIDLTLSPALAGASTAIVTGRVPTEGDLVDAGDVAIEVAGRPVFVLPGELPAYRTLGPGMAGGDVRQLEAALSELGLLTETPDEIYGDATERALGLLYIDAGYDPADVTPDEQAALDQATDAVDRGEQDLENAETQLADAKEPMAESERLRWETDLASATRNRDAAVAEANRVRGADPAIDAAVRSYNNAIAEGVTGTALQPYQAEIDAAVAVRDQAVVQADAQVVVAKEQLAITQASYDEAFKERDLTTLETAVVDAEARLEEAKESFSDLDAEFGVRLPQAEVVFLDALPRRVARIVVGPGDEVNGPVMRISGAEIVVEGGIPASNRSLVDVGSRAIMIDNDLGIEVEGEIVEIASTTGTNGQSESRYWYRITPIGDVDLDALVSVPDIRVVIPIQRSEGEVLVVPDAALSTRADDSIWIQRLDADETVEDLEVAVGLSADGYTEVRSLGAELGIGDLVVVGIDRSSN